MYSNIKVYQKYLVTSIKVGCATRNLYASSGPKTEGVPTNNQRGRGSGPCRLWGGCETDFVVYIRRFIYKFLNVCPFDYTAVAGSGKVGPVNQVNHTSWVAVVTPTDRPKSVRNRYVIELFCGVVSVVTLPLWQFCWCMGFCHRTESDLFLFSSYSCITTCIR